MESSAFLFMQSDLSWCYETYTVIVMKQYVLVKSYIHYAQPSIICSVTVCSTACSSKHIGVGGRKQQMQIKTKSFR